MEFANETELILSLLCFVAFVGIIKIDNIWLKSISCASISAIGCIILFSFSFFKIPPYLIKDITSITMFIIYSPLFALGIDVSKKYIERKFIKNIVITMVVILFFLVGLITENLVN